MMQFETVSPPNATPISQTGHAREPRSFGLTDTRFWRLVPMAFGLAAWLPQILFALSTLERLPQGVRYPKMAGSGLKNVVLQLIGPDGLILLGAVLTGAMAYGVWAIARAIAAPRWGAALVASLFVVAPVLGLTPSAVLYPDEAAFSALVALSVAALIWTSRLEDSNFLMLAFVLAILACYFRPSSGWPAIAVGLGAWVATKKLEEGPWLGMASGLCWAPGLSLAQAWIVGEKMPASLDGKAPNVLDAVRDGARDGVVAVTQITPSLLSTFLTIIPLVVLGALAAIGVALIILSGRSRKRAGVAASVALCIAVLGAAGYGSLPAARILLDPLFLSFSAAIALILPTLWPKWMAAWRARFPRLARG